ncbi:hypothetical protein [Virgibacillus senegalensis]|uniref:hypothetical protein n=1 Tax=Virgibacillus senegalensis TaxID=1499679 RepID=UPI00069D2820|nr:hypothetical protein [Virgibacillus senegalensis]
MHNKRLTGVLFIGCILVVIVAMKGLPNESIADSANNAYSETTEAIDELLSSHKDVVKVTKDGSNQFTIETTIDRTNLANAMTAADEIIDDISALNQQHDFSSFSIQINDQQGKSIAVQVFSNE